LYIVFKDQKCIGRLIGQGKFEGQGRSHTIFKVIHGLNDHLEKYE
jgi:hypothetical protein